MNWDTMGALNKLARLMHKRTGNFFFAGTKDKRGITVQRVIGKNMSAYHLATGLSKSKHWKLNEIACSNLEEVDYGTKLGDLWGNRFTMALRLINQAPEQSDVDERI